MKINKSIFALLMVSVISLIVLSCSKDEYESPLKGQIIPDVVIECYVYSDFVSLQNGDYSKCTITSSESWCKPFINKNKIEFDTDPNDSYDDRQAIITMTDPEDGTIMTFKLVQKQKNAILTERSSYRISEDGGNFTINVDSNIDYVVEIPSSCIWLQHVSSTRGLSKSQVTLYAQKNDTEEDRNVVIKLTNSETNTSTDVEITQVTKEFFEIEPTSCDISELGGELEVKIKANVNYNIDISDSWVKAGDKIEKEKNRYIQKLVVKSYDGLSSRSCRVTFNVDTRKLSTSKFLTITQTKALKINNSNVRILVGENYDLKLINNSGSPVTWSSSNTSVARVDAKGLVTAVGIGTATITVMTVDGKYSDKIVVTVYDNKTPEQDNPTDEEQSEEEGDITTKISHTFSSGFTSYVTSSGAFSGYFLDCILKNNSKSNITLKKCDAYYGDTYIDTQNFNTTLKGGSSKTVKLTNQIGFNGTYIFKWTYEYNGVNYTYTCRYN